MEAFTSRDRGENGVGVTTSTSSSVVSETEYFVFHKVSKLDTLAGIAIKYNVQVGEIKLANGLHSDMSLFAREHIKIPKKKLPPSMYYKPESKNSSSYSNGNSMRTMPLTGGNMSVAMTQLKNYYGLEKNKEQHLQEGGEGGGGRRHREENGSVRGGMGIEGLDSLGLAASSLSVSDGEANGVGASGSSFTSANANANHHQQQQSFKPSLSHSGIVETIMKKQEESLKTKEVHHKMNGSSDKIAEEKGLGAAAKRADLMRKRNKETLEMQQLASSSSSATGGSSMGGSGSPRKSKSPGFSAYPSRAPLFDSVSNPSNASKLAMSHNPPPTQKKESLFQKIKKAANKPALAPSMSRSVKLTDVGDATLKGLRSAKSDTGGVLSAAKLASKAD